jgi:hypothetical protein
MYVFVLRPGSGRIGMKKIMRGKDCTDGIGRE